MSARSYAVAKATEEIARLVNQIGASGEESGVIKMGSVFDIYEAAMLEAGWKMTPRETDDAMDKAGKKGILTPAHLQWPSMWDAAPSPGDES